MDFDPAFLLWFCVGLCFFWDIIMGVYPKTKCDAAATTDIEKKVQKLYNMMYVKTKKPEFLDIMGR